MTNGHNGIVTDKKGIHSDNTKDTKILATPIFSRYLFTFFHRTKNARKMGIPPEYSETSLRDYFYSLSSCVCSYGHVNPALTQDGHLIPAGSNYSEL